MTIYPVLFLLLLGCHRVLFILGEHIRRAAELRSLKALLLFGRDYFDLKVGGDDLVKSVGNILSVDLVEKTLHKIAFYRKNGFFLAGKNK